ncbi:MAG: hypothetical protein AAB215_03170, partial [Planctomycetota bacterium]
MIPAGALGVDPAAAPAERDLVVNGGFERSGDGGEVAASWSGDPRTYARDAAVSHGGSASLKFLNSDPQRYDLFSQDVPLAGGQKFEMSAWIKTRDLTGADAGATLCLEWYDRDGKWMDGAYAAECVKGTRDWTRIRLSARLPEGPKRFVFRCFVRRGMIGTAWFDDVEIGRVAEPPLRSFVLSPPYRGILMPDGPKDVRIRAVLQPPADRPAENRDLELTAEIVSKPGGSRTAATVSDGTDYDLSLPVADFGSGAHTVRVRFARRGQDKPIATEDHALFRADASFRPAVMIDAHRRVLADGRPFFPLGMYWPSLDEKEKDLKVYEESAFNCLMPYGPPSLEQMDLAQKHGMKVIYPVHTLYAGMKYTPPDIRTPEDEERVFRATLRRFRDHPALLAWYLNDEIPQAFLKQLENHQKWAREEDPGHPTWIVMNQVVELLGYVNTFDAVGTDPYPVGKRAASQAAEWTRKTVRTFASSRPVWMVPQVFNWADYPAVISPETKKTARTPTAEEMRSMAWQCICEGANGLIFYSWFDLRRNPDVPFATQWARVKAIAKEIGDLSPVLLSAEPPGEVRVQAGPWLHWTARRNDGVLYVFAVNDGDGEGRASFTVPGAARDVKVRGET